MKLHLAWLVPSRLNSPAAGFRRPHSENITLCLSVEGQSVDVDFLLPRNSVIADRVGSSLEVGATTILSEGVTIDER